MTAYWQTFLYYTGLAHSLYSAQSPYSFIGEDLQKLTVYRIQVENRLTFATLVAL